MSGDHNEDNSPEILSVVDEDGEEQVFEILDETEIEDITYLALMPIYDNETDIIDDPGELVILKIINENGEDILSSIDDDEEFDRAASIFESRLSDLFEIERLDD